MTYQSKAVLKGIKKLTGNSENIVAFLGNTTELCLYDDTDATYNYEKYQDEIDGIISALVEQGYLNYGFNNYHFRLTQKAIHGTQYNVENIVFYLKDNWIAISALIISIFALIKSA